MSYSFELKIDKDIAGAPLKQRSPLRFNTAEEAFDFGRFFFEPPKSVERWAVIRTNGRPNCRYKDGKFVEKEIEDIKRKL